MNLLSGFRLAVRCLGRNKVRTFLTMLGIIIGIASVVAVVAMGQGASLMIQDQISSMGRNILIVMPGAANSGGTSLGAGSNPTLTPPDGDAIVQEVPSARALTPLERTRAQIAYGSHNWAPSSMAGVGTRFLDVRDWELADGAFFTDSDVTSGAKVCVIGQTVVENLFQQESPVGKVIRIKAFPFKVVGTLSRKGTSATGQDQDDFIALPWTTVKRVLQGSAFNDVDQLVVSVDTPQAMDEATQDITALLVQRHRLRAGDPPDFRIVTMNEMNAALIQTSNVMTMLLAVIASISLLIGGIGIMNIMLVSVAERTREIGLRMAVGARERDVLLQFLMEALVLSMGAGIVGMIVGVASAVMISSMLNWPTLISPSSIGIAFVFSCGVGVFFGFYPAWRASRLDPIEALRYE